MAPTMPAIVFGKVDPARSGTDASARAITRQSWDGTEKCRVASVEA